LEFEYRRPEIEQALMTAPDLETLEAALASVIALQPDLGRPDVYGHKLFAPGLDAAVPAIARRLGLTDTRQAKSNDNVCIVATQLYASGGHSKVAYDIGDLIGAKRLSGVYTDIYGKLKHTDLIGAMTQDAPLKRRADVLLGARDLVGKTVELYNILAAIQPTRIFMLTHHFDMVAAVALWPFRDVVEFLHHADHVPSIGATLPFSRHVDLTWTCHLACKRADLNPFYAGMAVRSGRELSVANRDGGGGLRIATCGPAAKYRGRASHCWTDYAVAALQTPGTEMVHIGAVDAPFQAEVRQALQVAGIDADRYQYTGTVPDLAAELVAQRADVYLSSYPAGGARANLEAMSVGLPAIAPIDAASPDLLKFAFPVPIWIPVRGPQDLAAAIAHSQTIRSDVCFGVGRDAVRAELAMFVAYVNSAEATPRHPDNAGGSTPRP
jgi:hypothetical protein